MADTSSISVSKPDQASVAGDSVAPVTPGFFTGVAGKLLLYTVGMVLLVQVLLFPLFLAERRSAWLLGRSNASDLVVLNAQSIPDRRVSDEYADASRTIMFIRSIVARTGEQRDTILRYSEPIDGEIVTLHVPQETAFWSIPAALGHFMSGDGRYLKLLFKPVLSTAYDELEIIVAEDSVRQYLMAQSGAIALNIFIFSAVAGAAVYFMVSRIVVRPMRAIADSVTRFSETPETPLTEMLPADMSSGQSDEIRRVVGALEIMQRTVSTALRQRKRLADLGEAVAKISHDLRNSLSAAQVLSDGLADSNDPQVRDAAPRLERAIQRAVTLAEATLKYGRSETPLPNLISLQFAPAIEEAVTEGIAGWPGVQVRVECDDGLQIVADADHLHRIITNLVRNSARAISNRPAGAEVGLIEARVIRDDDEIVLVISDNGPGVPKSVLTKLFQPFSKAGSDGGTGLGLAIARELACGMGGKLALASSGPTGSSFALTLRAG
ncbi:MAG: HAMP domain-containing sensor histidine kinase [Hyphomonadaceae bacterium]